MSEKEYLPGDIVTLLGGLRPWVVAGHSYQSGSGDFFRCIAVDGGEHRLIGESRLTRVLRPKLRRGQLLVYDRKKDFELVRDDEHFCWLAVPADADDEKPSATIRVEKGALIACNAVALLREALLDQSAELKPTRKGRR